MLSLVWELEGEELTRVPFTVLQPYETFFSSRKVHQLFSVRFVRQLNDKKAIFFPHCSKQDSIIS